MGLLQRIFNWKRDYKTDPAAYEWAGLNCNEYDKE